MHTDREASSFFVLVVLWKTKKRLVFDLRYYEIKNGKNSYSGRILSEYRLPNAN